MNPIVQANESVVGVFDTLEAAQDAINDLKRGGFTEAHLGFAAPSEEPTTTFTDDAAKTAAAGAATGLGAGALWGLAILGGILPGIGPALVGGTLTAVLSSAAVGAGSGGLLGALIGLGFTNEDAQMLEDEFHAGKVVVTVTAGDRADTARAIIEHRRQVEAGATTSAV